MMYVSFFLKVSVFFLADSQSFLSTGQLTPQWLRQPFDLPEYLWSMCHDQVDKGDD